MEEEPKKSEGEEILASVEKVLDEKPPIERMPPRSSEELDKILEFVEKIRVKAHEQGQKSRASWRLVNVLEKEILDLNNLLSSWLHEHNMYRDAWAREIGGLTRPKHHEIDSFVLSTRAALAKKEEIGYGRGKEEMRDWIMRAIGHFRVDHRDIPEVGMCAREINSVLDRLMERLSRADKEKEKEG